MNYTTAKCGHAVPAVGCPNSEARRKCEQSACNDCRRKSIEAKLTALEKMMSAASSKDLPGLNATYQKLLEQLP